MLVVAVHYKALTGSTHPVTTITITITITITTTTTTTDLAMP